MCVCTRVCVHACIHMHVCAGVCTCSEHYSCVCRCMSVEEAGAGEWGENARVRLFYTCYFICTFLSPCIKGNFHFNALYIDE